MLPAFPLNPPKKVEAKAPDDLLSSVTGQANSDEPVEAYYPGTEINGFMPHRGDFATVSDYTYYTFLRGPFLAIFAVKISTYVCTCMIACIICKN